MQVSTAKNYALRLSLSTMMCGSKPCDDSARALVIIEEDLKRLLVLNGCPAKVRWILSGDLFVDGHSHYWIRNPDSNSNGAKRATHVYKAVLKRNLDQGALYRWNRDLRNCFHGRGRQ